MNLVGRQLSRKRVRKEQKHANAFVIKKSKLQKKEIGRDAKSTKSNWIEDRLFGVLTSTEATILVFQND